MNETTPNRLDESQINAPETSATPPENRDKIGDKGGDKKDEKDPESWGSFVWFCVKLVLVVLIFRAFIFASFNIPSESMLPRLLIGDHLFAAKWPYGFSSNSLPFKAPLISGRIFASDPERGDIAVFAHPVDGIEYIKRVVGLPGDVVQVIGGAVHLNGAPLGRERIEDFVMPSGANGHCRSVTLTQRSDDGQFLCVYPQFKETLPSGVSYHILDFLDGPHDNTAPVTVPEGKMFVMGDNRDNSLDSRFPAQANGGVGLVPLDNLIARASMIFYSSGDDGIRWNRIGDGL